MDVNLPTIPNDLDAFWMPFTANKQFKSAPRLLVSARDMHYRSHDGRDILDGAAGLWCCNAGHCRPRIVDAIQRQAATLDFAPTFQMAHPLSFEAASRVAALFPDGLDHVFFTNSGSEACDTALKLALAYHQARGEGRRTRLIGRERGYHGVGFGGISVGGIGTNRRAFGPLLPGIDHLPHTFDLARNAFSRGQPQHGVELADALERIIALHDASTIAAVIVEPLSGSTGVLPPPLGYLERLREICSRHGIVLIYDEVISGFGRLGAAFAVQRFGVTPDLVCIAKGITNGTVPMGAVVATNAIHDAINDSVAAGIELFHGYTYSGHPLAAAACIAALDTYAEEALFERAAELAPYWEERAHGLRHAGGPIIDIRNLGLVCGIEMAPRPGAPGARGYDLFTRAYANGLLMRFTGDIVAMSPPLIISRNQIDEMFGLLGRLVAEID